MKLELIAVKSEVTMDMVSVARIIAAYLADAKGIRVNESDFKIQYANHGDQYDPENVAVGIKFEVTL